MIAKRFLSFSLVVVLSVGITGCGKKGTSKKDIPALLKQYERIVEEFVPLMAGALSGDLSKQATLTKTTRQLEEVVEKLESLKEKMTDEEQIEYIRITMKMLGEDGT
jgi:uncharacterized lipoprotein YehR (DUF1307 family)